MILKSPFGFSHEHYSDANGFASTLPYAFSPSLCLLVLFLVSPTPSFSVHDTCKSLYG